MLENFGVSVSYTAQPAIYDRVYFYNEGRDAEPVCTPVPSAFAPRRKPVTRKANAKRASNASRKRAPSNVNEPEAVFRRYINSLGPENIEFATARHDLAEWMAAIDTPMVSDVMLARWLVAAGYKKRRVGRAKVTIYVRKSAK